MNIGTEDRKKLAILGVAGAGALAAVVYIYGQLFPSTPPATPPAATVSQPPPSAPRVATPAPVDTAVPGVARKLGTTAAALDPTLHMSAMLTTESLQYHGSGRNIFSANAAAAAPVHIPRPISSGRPSLAPAAYTPPAPTGPPPINLLFFGTAMRAGQPPRAFLLHGDDVVLASAGDIVQRRYKILSISATSITVEDLSDEHQQTLPLRTN